MFKKVSFLILALCLLTGAQVFMGCDANSGDDGGGDSIPLPEALKGVWTSVYNEEYTISDAEFSASYGGGNVHYSGLIVHVRSDGSGAGYITIRYATHAEHPEYVGKYYVIHYKDLTASTVAISGAANGVPPDYDAQGYAEQADAEGTYTVLQGYFNIHSSTKKVADITNHPSPVTGTWLDEDSTSVWDTNSMVFKISERTVSFSYGEPAFVGAIVNVRDLNDGTGYITFRYLFTNFPDCLDKFSVIYWDLNNATEADLALAQTSLAIGDVGESTQEAAETEYTEGNVADYFSGGTYYTYNKQ
jgi:hypothetical protein